MTNIIIMLLCRRYKMSLPVSNGQLSNVLTKGANKARKDKLNSLTKRQERESKNVPLKKAYADDAPCWRVR